MYRLREQVAQRRVLTKPCFQDFDMYVCVCVYVCARVCLCVFGRSAKHRVHRS